MRRWVVVSMGLAGWLLAVSAASAQQRPAITGIAFARVYAADTFASDAFYRMLGFPPEGVGEASEDQVKRYDVNGSQWIEVAPLPDPAPQARLAAVGFTTRDAAGLEKYLKARGITIVEPLAGGEFTVLDPESNRIVFVQAGSHAMSGKRTDGVGEKTSGRIIHAGFMVKSSDAEDRFYRDVLGFHAYWHGGNKDGETDWVSLQVPEGSDWLEYMLNTRLSGDAKKDLQQLGVQDHFSLGVEHMQSAVDALAKNGCAASPEAENCTKTVAGKDGKVQMNVYDPDRTRVEYMEFKASGTTCCSEIKGKVPTEVEEK